MSRSARPADRSGRAYTLLELVIVLAILAALAGLALPGLVARVAGNTQTAVTTRLVAAAAICRSESQRRGIAIELAAIPADGRTLIVGRAAADPTSQTHPPGEVLLELPEGCAIRAVRPDAESMDSSPFEDEPGEGRVELTIATFMPDGSAAAPAATLLVFRSSAFGIRVARWTGGLSLMEHGGEPGDAEEAPVDDAANDPESRQGEGESVEPGDTGGGLDPTPGAGPDSEESR